METIDFRGFRFGKIHTSDLHLEVVSTSNRYENRTLPAPTDQTVDIPGSDGQYYFGSIFKNREITCNVAFDNISESDYRRIRQVFATDKLQDLVFDEEPYKTWRAKLKAKPTFKSLCFTDKESGQRVYKGEGTLNFICYFPYAFCFDKYVVRAADYYMLNEPECIIKNREDEDFYIKSVRERNMGRILPEDIKYHYNLNPSDFEGGEIHNVLENDDNDSFKRDVSHQNKHYTDKYNEKYNESLGTKNWEPNDKHTWKTGFPTIEQVQAGELFFDTPQGEKTVIDVRSYWDNVPEWQSTAKLLTTPTLDFEQELMYLPQYSKVDFINTDIGFQSYRPMIGSRILVYNPGDLPVDWELKIDENKRGFWSCRGGPKFRVRRFNVQRLTIPNAVDWCGLKTYKPEDDVPYKYGDRYFRRRVFNKDRLIENIKSYYGNETEYTTESEKYWFKKPNNEDYYSIAEIIDILRQGHMIADKYWPASKHSVDEVGEKRDESVSYRYENWNASKEELKEHRQDENWYGDLKVAFNLHLDTLPNIWDGVIDYEYLNEAHPNHCYYVEPIPRQRMAHYIKLFYWQTIQWRGTKTKAGDWTGLSQWKEMMPDDFWVDSTTKDKIANPDHPLVNFIRMFQYIKEDGSLYYKKRSIRPHSGQSWEDTSDIKFIKDGDLSIKVSESTELIPNHQGSITTTYYEVYRTDIRELLEDLDFEEGIAFANRYQEMYDLCITEEEYCELYWDTLKKLLDKFSPMISVVTDYEKSIIDPQQSRLPYNIVDFIYDYINNPSEYIGTDTRDLDYDQTIFNAFKNPEWITDDYMEIDSSLLAGVDIIKQYLAAVDEDFDAVFNGKLVYYDKARLEKLGGHSSLIKKLDKQLGDGGCLNDLLDDYYYLNSESRMLYSTPNPYGMEFVYKPTKLIQNDAIHKGKWFKLPPGWSLLDIEPVVDETLWGGKRWRDGRPFDWGYGGDLLRNKREVQQLYDFVNDKAREEFLENYKHEWEIGLVVSHNASSEINIKTNGIIAANNIQIGNGEFVKYDDKKPGTEDNKDELFKFKVWYESSLEHFPVEENYFAYGIYKKRQNDAEYFFLKTIDGIWQLIAPYYSWTALKGVYFDPDTELPPQNEDYDITGLPLRCINGVIGDWWWYACNYLWANFPPLYWTMADMLNNLMIKYVPLFY